ncbi:MAG: tRNA (adenosine(37)-N6)-threonylcarbamoyltransferase complex dimerization subunit type 1 TsaB [Solirubrobacteraceae bacterium]
MKILGFDTATRATAVALLDTHNDEALERRDDPEPGVRPRHTTRLMALIVDVMDGAGTGWTAIDRIAVGVGPGTFTGLRIGVATAHALSRARDIPLVGVSTLHSLARGAVTGGEVPEDAVMAVIDARRGEVFAGGWATQDVARSGAEPLLPPRPLAPTALAQTIGQSDRAWLAVGDGAIEFRSALERSGARILRRDAVRNRVSAIEHCRLASGMAPVALGGVQPEYLRLPDAEITLRSARQS